MSGKKSALLCVQLFTILASNGYEKGQSRKNYYCAASCFAMMLSFFSATGAERQSNTVRFHVRCMILEFVSIV